MPSRLNDKDTSLILSNKTIDLNEDKNAYLGGPFGTNEKDYIEVLIYDTNNNFLESTIVNSDDYEYYNSGVKLKTGTILRKMGYDRGKFVVKYNFLRKLAGSWETLLTNNDDTLYTEEFNRNDPNDIAKIGDTLFLKENKYVIHEISPTRTEIRLIPQHIKNEKYLRDFFNLGRTVTKYKSNQDDESKLEFKTSGDITAEHSTEIGFVATSQGEFTPDMIGGTLVVPNVFITSEKTFGLDSGDVGDTTVEQFETVSNADEIQARFFVDEADCVGITDNSTGNRGDFMLNSIFQKFKGPDNQGYAMEEFPPFGPNEDNSSDGINWGMGDTDDNVARMKWIWNLDDSKFKPQRFHDGAQNNSIILVSNSTVPGNTTTQYTWEFYGWDENAQEIFHQIRPTGPDGGGHVEILNVDDPSFATKDGANELKAVNTLDVTENNDGTITRPLSKVKFRIHSEQTRVGVILTINQNLINKSSRIHMPACIETDNS
jgi:hypothetical protein